MSKIANLQVRVPATMPEKFIWLKAILRDTALSASAKNVATALMTFHNDRSGQCNPSQGRLAEAVGLSRRRVNGLVAELKAGGWIDADGTLGASNYRLVLDRAAEAIEAGEIFELDAPPTSELTYPYVRLDVPPTSSLTYPYVKPDVQNHPGNHQEEPQRGTTLPTTALAAIEPEEVGSAKTQSAMPDKSKANLPVPANDDTVGMGGETFSGFFVPDEVMRQWVAAFADTNVRSTVMHKASWAMSIPAYRRIKAMEGLLRKLDKEPRDARISRREAKQADTETGIERDFHGRVIGAPKTSRYQW